MTSDIPGPTLVLTHGFLMDETMFEPMREPLAAAGINLVTIDARCHGRTQSPDGEPFTYWDMAADTLSVMDELGIEKAVIGGMGQGGYTALRLALLAPERVRGLALIDTDAGACTEHEVDFYHSFFERWASAEPMAPLVAELAPLLIGGNDPRLWRAWTSRWYTGDRQAVLPAARCLAERRSLLHRLCEIGAPTLVIRGSQDGTSTARKNAAMAAGLVNADGVVTIPGAGQGAAWTHPEVLGPLLIRLVRRASARPANPLTQALARAWPERTAAEIHIAR
ncbi:alpha/beta hydrolase [Nocardia sp. NBC_01503]|uniref:alpha/beta fold hydrolase n=1 Tax=Nocardia sp. NBC_01503 TaxID=2975997 RepID=UPI002E7BCC5B|nr:alpha/beta hydrolase [Nocardia sp. NBC_01503]WTL36011.1 alpha/beta hydrolase [Nocardia sp. NBC_01503]